jgi:hypothetical protein
MKKQQFDKTQFVHVDHPQFEAHNFHSLARATGYSATGLAMMYANGVYPMLATNFGKAKNCFVVGKEVIKMLKARKEKSR